MKLINIPTSTLKNTLLIMAALLILFACLVLGGCGTKYRAKKCVQLNCCPTVHDSSGIIHKPSTDTVFVKDGKAILDLMLKCDSSGQVYIYQIRNLENQNTDLKLSFDSLGRMIIHYKRPQDTVYMPQDSVIQFRDRIVQNPPVTTNIVTKWQAFQIWTGRIVLILLLIYLVYYVVRKFVLKV